MEGGSAYRQPPRALRERSSLDAIVSILKTPYPGEREERKMVFSIRSHEGIVSFHVSSVKMYRHDTPADIKESLETFSMSGSVSEARDKLISMLGGKKGDSSIRFDVREASLSHLAPKAEDTPASEFQKLVKDGVSSVSEIHFELEGNNSVTVYRSVAYNSSISQIQITLASNIVEYVKGDDSSYFFSLEGAKGSGKSFIAAFAAALLMQEKRKVSYIRFGKEGAAAVLPGYSKPNDADLVIVDDLHYFLQGVMNGEIKAEMVDTLVDLLQTLKKQKKKVVLISDQPLAYYAELVGNKRLKRMVNSHNLNLESHTLEHADRYMLSRVNKMQRLGLDANLVASIAYSDQVVRFMILVSQMFENPGNLRKLGKELITEGMDARERTLLEHPVITSSYDAVELAQALSIPIGGYNESYYVEWASSEFNPTERARKLTRLKHERLARDIEVINSALADRWKPAYVQGADENSYVLGEVLVKRIMDKMKGEMTSLLRNRIQAPQTVG